MIVLSGHFPLEIYYKTLRSKELGKRTEEIAGQLQEELNCIGSWCTELGALVNPTKAVLNNYIINTICQFA